LPEFLVGNIRDRPFSKLWSDSASPVLARFRDKQARFGGRCSDCRYRELCGGGCRVRAYAASGDFLAEDPFCYVPDLNPVIRDEGIQKQGRLTD
jgi:radical SAM protein with 4Fe4S-binding SPASM domain